MISWEFDNRYDRIGFGPSQQTYRVPYVIGPPERRRWLQQGNDLGRPTL
jgi:hypothetical protein